jgi:hypothetical protein
LIKKDLVKESISFLKNKRLMAYATDVPGGIHFLPVRPTLAGGVFHIATAHFW